jgi:hypothetical protein
MKDAPSPLPWVTGLTTLAGLAAVIGLGYLAWNHRPAAPAPGTNLATAPTLSPCRMDQDGYLRGSLHAAVNLDIDWRGEALACAGNARPDGTGLRLFFAGVAADSGERIVLVIGLEAGIAGLAGREVPASVTVIDEASSEFFHAGAGRCLSNVTAVQPLSDARFAYRVEGELYCAGAIPAVTGSHSVTLGDMAYAGRLALDPA